MRLFNTIKYIIKGVHLIFIFLRLNYRQENPFKFFALRTHFCLTTVVRRIVLSFSVPVINAKTDRHLINPTTVISGL